MLQNKKMEKKRKKSRGVNKSIPPSKLSSVKGKQGKIITMGTIDLVNNWVCQITALGLFKVPCMRNLPGFAVLRKKKQ